ncbi:branched-chain amino acid ABC transporter permease [Desulfohalobiaceae bacterium Ax17]|uniref:branched-chain amino acid ABC transporter permease n=1 Tax=Desulfovulcanus ferrireducens TaxID=2831190 RepID=UPI00207BCF0A|nr:branched-chain amino acid ABC transporter permease [Desulfovulcanus ferrireducens]MBT8764178.1 branched-chain amino acid ABC transporter permease [Desulfovulcanus ferrireducens]
MRRFTVPLTLLLLFGLLVGLSYYELIDLYTQSVLMFMGINIIYASSLNLVNGYMGEFSCGHAGFMAVGAYVASVLSVLLFAQDRVFGPPLLSPEYAILGFPLILVVAFIVAALAGLLIAIPSFKTRGDYLAIITIAANYIIITTIINLDSIGGARGFMGMKNTIFAMEDVVFLPWMIIWVFIFTVLSIWMIRRFVSSTLGKGIVAIHQDEVAAEIMSVNTNKMKLIAFMISSGLAGVAGALFAHVLGYVNPSSFGILKSTEALVMVYLGGMGSLSGSVLSAIAFTLLLELLRPLQIIKWIVVPLLLIILMQFRPEGIMGNKELSDIFPGLRKLYKFK